MTVYVIQQQMKRDINGKGLVPKFTSLHKAEKWGKLEYLLSPSASPFNPQNVLGDMHFKLVDFKDEDHLLLIGNPTLIGMATAVAAHYNQGRVKFLQWSGRHGEYTEISAEIF